MPSFRYQARLPDGRLQSGLAEAPSVEDATEALVERGYEVLSLEPYRGAAAASQSLTNLLNRITNKELVGTVRMMAVMVDAQVPVADAIRNVVKQSRNPKLKGVMSDIANEVEGGARFSDALERYPKVFSAFFINMVRSGETTGQLTDVLNYLADQQEKDYDLTAKMRNALMYPGFIIVSMVVIGFVMMTYVIPKLTEVFKEGGMELPLSTRVLMGASDFLVAYWWVVILGAVVFGIGFFYWVQTAYGRLQWDRFKLRIPVLGGLYRDIYTTRFCQSMFTLMKGGVTMVQALEVAASVMGNEVWKQMILQTIVAVNDGQPLVSVMSQGKEMPTMAIQMMTVGEETGRMSDVLSRLSEFYGRSVSNMAAGMLTLIEPIVMVTLAIGVGFMVSAIMLPMYQMTSGV